jgi:hypothetical protein
MAKRKSQCSYYYEHGYLASNVKTMAELGELQEIWKEGVVAYLKIFRHLTGVSEENLSWNNWWPS